MHSDFARVHYGVMTLSQELCAVMALLHVKWIGCVVSGCSAVLRCR